MDESEDLALFAGPDEHSAAAAFERLAARARRFLQAYLRGSVADADAREDVAQTALANVWKSRPGFRNLGVAAWYGLLKRTADRCWLDELARHRLPLAPTPVDDVSEPELAVVDGIMSLLSAEIESGALQHRAHVLWLGLDPALQPEQQERRLLAAQLHYLDGAPWHEVLRLVGGAPGEPPLSRHTFDDWMEDPGTLRHLAYETLYFSNHRLAAHLLRTAGGPEGLDELMRRSARMEAADASETGWQWREVSVILWRYRHSLLVEQILARRDCSHTPDELRELLDRTRGLFPFREEMLNLLTALERHPGLRGREALGGAGLWQRLAFQYAYGDELPHRDVGERIEPAAQQVDYRVTPAMLNVWISGRRLLGRLAHHLGAEHSGSEASHE